MVNVRQPQSGIIKVPSKVPRKVVHSSFYHCKAQAASAKVKKEKGRNLFQP